MTQLTLQHRTSGTLVSTVNMQETGWVLDYIPTAGNKETVTEKFKILIEETTTTALRTKINAIETMLDIARRHPTGPEGVWMLYTPDAAPAVAYQSRLVDGLLMFDNRTEHLWTVGLKLVDIIVERRNYWESQTAVTLELNNRHVTDASPGPIDNAQDVNLDLYVEIADDQVTGVLPTPAILEFENTPSSPLLDDLLVGVIHGDGDSTLPTPTTLVSEGAPTADVNCSSGEYVALSWVDADENELETWTIPSGDFLQKRYRAVARLRNSVAYVDLWLKVKLLIGTTEIAETRWSLVEANKQLVIIGSMNIPPYALGEAIDLGNITLALYEKRADGAGSMNLDYILLMPQDSWRRYIAITGLDFEETLIDDPVREVLVTEDDVGDFKVTHKAVEGDPLMLRPGVENVFYFLQQDTTGAAPIARTASVTIKYHPRRLTV